MPHDYRLHEEPSTWDRFSAADQAAISAGVNSGQVLPAGLALYARWWQLETWLRSLAYVEVRARDGAAWADGIYDVSSRRLQGDKRYAYMASPDWEDPLAYMDASKLFDLIDSNWKLFAPALLEHDA